MKQKTFSSLLNVYDFFTYMSECANPSGGCKAKYLARYGIYLTNNAKKMHGEAMVRKVAGRKGVRKRE